jgi:pilus assembly protein CpaB
MNRNRLVAGLTVAILVALLASMYVYRAFERATRVKPTVTETIVVAGRELQVGERLDSDNIRMISWPADEPLAGSFRRNGDCIGRAVISPMATNEPVLEANLAPREAGAGLPAAIPEGMRAVSVAVNDVVGVAGFVIPGTMVDVLTTGRLPGNGQGNDNNITRTILENVRVLAAGQKIEQDRDGKPEKVPVVTLLVSPDDAAKLTMASTEGRIQLALRNTIDTKAVDPPAVLQAQLFSPPSAPVRVHEPAPKVVHAAPPPPYEVEVIVGDKRETKTFNEQ